MREGKGGRARGQGLRSAPLRQVRVWHARARMPLRPAPALLPTPPHSVFPCRTPDEVRAELPAGTDVVAFQCRNPIHRAHYELFIRALDAPNIAKDGVVLVHPTCGPTQARA